MFRCSNFKAASLQLRQVIVRQVIVIARWYCPVCRKMSVYLRLLPPLTARHWRPFAARNFSAASSGPRLSVPSGWLDHLELRGLLFHGYHGVLPEVGGGNEDWM